MRKKPFRHAKLHIKFKAGKNINDVDGFLDKLIELIESLKLSTSGPSCLEYLDHIIFNKTCTHIGYKKFSIIKKWLSSREEIEHFTFANRIEIESL